MSAFEVHQTEEFGNWLRRLRDDRAKARIVARIRRMELGNLGDTRPLGGGLAEIRIDYGPGYRIYIAYRSASVVLLLCGGDKQTQRRDIARAREFAEELEK
jgi:putative addiction module killer protein